VVRSLTLKFTLAFLLVSLSVAVFGAVFARLSTVKEFEQLVVNRTLDEFVQRVIVFYDTYGTVQGFSKASNWNTRIPRWLENPFPSNGNTLPINQRMPIPNIFTLVDHNGIVVFPSGDHQLGKQLQKKEISRGTIIEYNNELIGVVIITGDMPFIDKRDEQYLRRIDQTSIRAAFVAMLVAVLMAIFFGQSLTHPISELTHAIQEMSKGNLQQRVPVRSKDELGQLAESFNQMSRDLGRAIQARQQMTADIAHDLRTPLTVIAGYIEALRDGVLKPSPERFETLHNEVQILQRLVSDLRTLSLADAGELKLQQQIIHPNDLLQRIKSSYQHTTSSKGIDLNLELEENCPTIFIDVERMIQAIGNLVTNAIEYTPEGGMITLVSSHDEKNVSLHVIDTGEGIPPETIQNIFNRFYRGDNARSNKNGETGLGLAIAQSIVKAHGGEIQVKSEVGVGSEFTISIPIKITFEPPLFSKLPQQ
jgi:signal transduction histidine kinase